MSQNGKSTLVVTHATSLFGPPHALSSFLVRRSKNHVFISHPLSAADGCFSHVWLYRQGILQNRYNFGPWRGPELWRFWRQLSLNQRLFHSFDQKLRFDLIIGCNNLNAYSLIQFQSPKRRLIYYTVDYSPHRFHNLLLDNLYEWLDKKCLRQADYIWNITKRAATRAQKYDPGFQKNLVVPNGVWLDLVGHHKTVKSKLLSLVYHGRLTPSKGIQDVIKALAVLKQKKIFATFDIIGSGPFQNELEKMVRQLGLAGSVSFLGQKTNQEALQLLPQYDVGIALYNLSDDFNFYCDPMKVKEYLASGLPVIITEVPEVAQTIKDRRWGIVIKDAADLESAIKKLTDREFRSTCSRNAKESRKSFDWNYIFSQALNDAK